MDCMSSQESFTPRGISLMIGVDLCPIVRCVPKGFPSTWDPSRAFSSVADPLRFCCLFPPAADWPLIKALSLLFVAPLITPCFSLTLASPDSVVGTALVWSVVLNLVLFTCLPCWRRISTYLCSSPVFRLLSATVWAGFNWWLLSFTRSFFWLFSCAASARSPFVWAHSVVLTVLDSRNSTFWFAWTSICVTDGTAFCSPVEDKKKTWVYTWNHLDHSTNKLI